MVSQGGSFTWKHEGTVSEIVVLDEGLLLIRGFVYMET